MFNNRKIHFTANMKNSHTVADFSEIHLPSITITVKVLNSNRWSTKHKSIKHYYILKQQKAEMRDSIGENS